MRQVISKTLDRQANGNLLNEACAESWALKKEQAVPSSETLHEQFESMLHTITRRDVY
jgi:hypothetical protein